MPDKLRFPVVVAATLLNVVCTISLAGEAVKTTTPRLSALRVSTLAASAFNKSGEIVSHYDAGKPQFDSDSNTWIVFYRDIDLRVDGDKVVVVNDRTGKVCVSQAMAPPTNCK
jgi:hypothetical protein